MWKPRFDNKKAQTLFDTFLRKYSNKYDPFVLNCIKHNFYNGIGQRTGFYQIFQIYSELGIFNDEDNPYVAYLNNFKSHFDVGCNILDVASGHIPAFANLLAKEQLKIGKGTVTIYDPVIVYDKPKYPNMKMYHEKFTMKTDIKDYDIITGIFPCEATEIMLDQACKYNKDFYIALCGCVPDDYRYDEFLPEDFHDELIYQANSLLNGELVSVDRLDNKYEIDNPILYYKKK